MFLVLLPDSYVNLHVSNITNCYFHKKEFEKIFGGINFLKIAESSVFIFSKLFV